VVEHWPHHLKVQEFESSPGREKMEKKQTHDTYFFRRTAPDTPDNDIQDNIWRKRIFGKILLKLTKF
jgi:hypothetical protein